MRQFNFTIKFLCIAVLPILLNGCAGTHGQQGSVAMVDANTGMHLQTSLTMADYLRLTETVTNKMLATPFVQKWGSKRPKLIVGDLINNTDDESIRMRDLHDRIQEVVFNSGLARIVDHSANSFDYIIKSEMTSTRQYGSNNQELVIFTLQLKMYKLDGELVLQQSDDLALAKAERPLF